MVYTFCTASVMGLRHKSSVTVGRLCFQELVSYTAVTLNALQPFGNHVL